MAVTADAAWTRYTNTERWLVAAGGLVGMIANVLSSTSLTVAVPAIMGTFGVGQDMAQWTQTAYFAAMTSTMLVTAWLTQRFGQRAVFVATSLVFLVSIFIGAFAPNIEAVIFSRVLQGACGGIMQPLAMTVIFTVFPPERRGSAMGLFGLGVVLAPAVGPAVGGLAVDMFNWRYVFLLTLPLTFVGAVLGALYLPGRLEAPRRSFDWAGFLLLSAALALVLNGLASAPREGWSSDWIVIQLVLGTIAAIAFAWWQSVGRSPLLNTALFGNLQFSAAAIVGFVFGFGMFGSIYVMAVFLQEVQGFTPLKAGIALLPAGMLMVVMFPTAGRLNDSFPSHILIITGLCLFAYGFWLLSGVDPNTPYWTFIAFTLINRLGLSLIIPSLNTGSLRSLPPEQVSQGSGIINFTRMLGGACGVNLLVVFLQIRVSHHAEMLTATQTAANATSLELLAEVRRLLHTGGVAESHLSGGALDYLGQVVHAQAQTFAFQDTFLMSAVVAAAALVPAWIMRRGYHSASRQT